MNRKTYTQWLQLISFGAWPLTYKLMLIFLFTSLFPMGILSYLSLNSSLEQVEKDQKEHLELSSHIISTQIDQLLEQHKTFTQSFAKDPDVMNFLQAPQNPKLKELADNDLLLLTHSLKHVSHVSLIDTQGRFLTSSTPYLVGFSADFRDYFQQAIQGIVFISGLITGHRTQENGLFFAAPVYGEQQKIIGVVVLKLKESAIDELFIKNGLQHSTSIAFLVDENKNIIYHPDNKYRYKNIDALPSLRSYAAEKNTSQALLNTNSLEFDLNGVKYVSGLSETKQKNWHIYIAKPHHEFSTPIEKLFYKNLIILILCSLGSILLAWLLSRTFIRPINVLIQQAKNIKAGNYSLDTDKNIGLFAVAQRNDELGSFAKVFQSMVQEIYHREFALDQLVQQRTNELTTKNQILADTYARIDQELNLAHNMQQAILPQSFPNQDHFEIYANMHPAREMGGDFYDCFALDDGGYAIVVADVAGKGVASAFFMGVSSTIIRQAASLYKEPKEVLAFANTLLCERNPTELFVTVFYGVFYPEKSTLHYASAGHPAPLLRLTSGDITELTLAHDLPLGAWDTADYQQFMITLQPSEVLFIYTDGITEALSEAQEEFGEQRLHHWLQQQGKQLSAQDIFHTLKHSIKQFVGQAEPHDDMTVLLLRMQTHEPTLQNQWHITPDLAQISGLIEQVEHFLHPYLANQPEIIFQITLSIDEILNNIIKHSQHPASEFIHVLLGINHQSIYCEIKDQGIEFNPFTQEENADIDSELDQRLIGGLGVHLVKTLMDEYRYSRQESMNSICFYKHLPSEHTHEL